nr:uncharacterized protein LOC111512485 [Leptinotarsa decemlineata]
MNWSNDESWSVKCGYADLSTFTYTWDIHSCYTETLSDSKTRCICPKSGIFALLLALTPKPSYEESDFSQYILMIGCCLGMVLALFTTVCLAISCILLKKSCLMALKLQCSISIFATGLMFTLATITGPPQTYFLLFITTIEAFVLLGMSSHLSKLLIVFTDLIEVPKPMTSKYTVIGIISGVPVITVFGSHLSYKTMDIQLESWWMLKGTLSFNIFVGVASMMLVLFIFLYIVVMRKLQELIGIHEKYSRTIERRVALLRRSGCIFSAVTLFSVSSLIYINYPNKLWSVYQFSVYNVFLGLVLLFCYVIKAEIQFQRMFDTKSESSPNKKFFTFDSMSKPLNFITQQEAEVENESNPHLKTDLHHFTSLGRDTSKPSLTSKSQSIAATFESCLNTTTSFCDSQVDISSTSRSIQQPSVELYPNSPQIYRNPPCVSKACSPDILSNKVCVELDLVASSLKTTNKIPGVSSTQPTRHNVPAPIVVPTPDEAIATILETEIITFRPLHQYHVRTQPDGHDGCILAETTLETVEEVNEVEPDTPICTVNVQPLPSVSVQPPDSVQPSVSVVLPIDISHSSVSFDVESTSGDEPSSARSDKLDGMLDSISQDLEYLLNKTDVVPSSTLKRAPKSPKHDISQEILNELADLPESVTLRTSC